jgi:hypothetical protein
MNGEKVSRRRLVELGLGAAATATFVASTGAKLAHADDFGFDFGSGFSGDIKALLTSVNNAYLFLDQMMDNYANGSTVRLVQSYADQIGLQSSAFTYDNALAICAYLTRGRFSDVARAKVIGNGLLYAQQTDPSADGRFRQAYFVDHADSNGAFVLPGFSFFQGSAVGDVAWAGIALAQLFQRTREHKYLDGAVKAATFIETTTRDNANIPPGGYFFGNGQSNKSTEHNIDVYALFTILARLTGNAGWLDGAQHARTFVEAMYNATPGFFWTGTSDPTHIFFDNIPEDVQTWSYLAFLDKDFDPSLEWVKTNLATTDTSFAFNNGWKFTGNFRVSGETFASQSKLGTVLGDNTVDPDAVWCEGTSHLVAALFARGLPARKDIPSFHGDINTASLMLESIQVAQASLGSGQTVGGNTLVDGQGIVAATSPLITGFGFNFLPFRHIGATSWYVMAAQMANPLQAGLRTPRH